MCALQERRASKGALCTERVGTGNGYSRGLAEEKSFFCSISNAPGDCTLTKEGLVPNTWCQVSRGPNPDCGWALFGNRRNELKTVFLIVPRDSGVGRAS